MAVYSEEYWGGSWDVKVRMHKSHIKQKNHLCRWFSLLPDLDSNQD